MKKKIVVLGSAGNLGMYYLDYLLGNLNFKDYEIIACGTRSEYPYEFYDGKYIQLDITKKEDFKKLPTENVLAVVDFAGVLPAYDKDNDPDKYIDVNVKGTMNVLDYCVNAHVEKIIYTQTWSDLNGYLKDKKPLKPYLDYRPIRKGDHAVYCISKTAAVELMKHYYAEYGLKYFVFRLPNIYLYSPEEFYYVNGVKKYISYRYMIEKATKGEDIELWGNPKLGKDIIYVKDLCQMIYKAMFCSLENGIYNAGTGIKTTMKEQIEGMIKVFNPKGKKSNIIMCPDKPDCDDFVMDIDNIKKDLGFEVKYDYIGYLEDYKKERELKRFTKKGQKNNKKKVVIIGANEFQRPLVLKAKELGYETHAFAWEEGAVAAKDADYFYPISITEKHQILEECKKIKPDAVVTIASDLATLTTTYICEKLGLVTNSVADSLMCTNKYEMRKAFKKAGVLVPGFQKVTSVDEKIEGKFPKIVKPTDRSGSRAIALVNNEKELKAALKDAISNSFEKGAIVEDVILGDREYSCETISYKGKHHILAVTKKYTTGFPKCIETGHTIPSDLDEEEMANVMKVIPKALDALNIKYGPSHSEFKIDEDKNVHIIEIGARMGGDCIGSNLVQLATGYDFLKMTLDVFLGNKPEIVKGKHYNYSFIKFIFSKNDLEKVNKVLDKYPEILIERSEIEDMNHKIVDSSSRYGFFIFAFDSNEILDYIMKEVKLYE